jgi:hypothetical protein
LAAALYVDLPDPPIGMADREPALVPFDGLALALQILQPLQQGLLGAEPEARLQIVQAGPLSTGREERLEKSLLPLLPTIGRIV